MTVRLPGHDGRSPILICPSTWWSMLMTDAPTYSRKSVTDRRTGSSTTIEHQVRRIVAWSVPDGSAVIGAATFRGAGVLVTNGAADLGRAPLPSGEPPVSIDIDYGDEVITGLLRHGGPSQDSIPSPALWTVEFEVVAPDSSALVVATGYQIAEPPTDWTAISWSELHAHRRAWLTTLH